MPKADIAALLDYFVGAPDERIGDVDTKCLCGFEIQDHLHFRGLIDRQISRFFTFKYPAAVDADLSIQFGVIGSVAQQANAPLFLFWRTSGRLIGPVYFEKIASD